MGIDFSKIVAFLLGMLSGAILIVLIYLLLVLLTIKKRTYILETEAKDAISEQDVKDMIKKTQDKFLLERQSDNEEIKAKALQNGIVFMIQDIASKFYPTSKRPLAELTIDELLLLDKYIVKRIEEIVDRPGVRILKRLKLNTVINIVQAKKKVDESALVKTTKHYKLDKIFNIGKMVLNVINPVYWFKKLVINNAASLILKKISLCVISIAGEETYRVYSKQAFTEQDAEFENMVKEIAESGENIEQDVKQIREKA